MVAAVLQQIVCYLSYNMFATGDFFFFFKPVYFSLVKQQRETGWWAAAALAGCLAVKGIAEKALEADFGGIWGFFPSLCCAQTVLKEWAHKHSCVMELPSRQLPVSPAIMCWEKLVEKGANTRGGLWCCRSPGDSTPPPSWAALCVCQGHQLLLTIHILCFSFLGGRGQLPKACDSNLRSLPHPECVFWAGDDDYWAVLQFVTL